MTVSERLRTRGLATRRDSPTPRCRHGSKLRRGGETIPRAVNLLLSGASTGLPHGLFKHTGLDQTGYPRLRAARFRRPRRACGPRSRVWRSVWGPWALSRRPLAVAKARGSLRLDTGASVEPGNDELGTWDVAARGRAAPRSARDLVADELGGTARVGMNHNHRRQTHVQPRSPGEVAHERGPRSDLVVGISRMPNNFSGPAAAGSLVT